MKNIFLAFCLFISLLAISQQKPSFLQTKALQFAIDFNPDSSLYYYKILDEIYPDYQPVLVKSMVGYCYKNMGNLEKAKEYVLQSLLLYESMNSGWFDVAQTANALHEVYFQMKEYNKALFYLDATRTIYKPRMRSCMGEFGFFYQMKFAYDRALCFEGLGLTDSVVSTLAPWIFMPRSRDLMVDSSTYRLASMLFVSTATKIYGIENLKCLLNSGIENSSYNIRYSKGFGDYQMAYIDCSFKFLSAEIPLTSGGIGVKRAEDLPYYLKRDFLISEAKKSYSYKLIMDEKLDTKAHSIYLN